MAAPGQASRPGRTGRAPAGRTAKRRRQAVGLVVALAALGLSGGGGGGSSSSSPTCQPSCFAKVGGKQRQLSPEAHRRRQQHEVLKAANVRCWPWPLQGEALDPQLPTDDLSGRVGRTFDREPPEGHGRVRLRVAYDGTQYHGWARGHGGPLLTVGCMVDKALSLALGCDIWCTGAGRTDAGVHARGQAAHADVPLDALERRPADWAEAWESKVNRLLPNDVRVFAFEDAPAGFHAVLSAVEKTYVYRLHVGLEQPDPLERLYRHRISFSQARLLGGDLGRMREAAARFCGSHDFAYFTPPDPTKPANRTTIRTIHSIELVDEGRGRCRLELRLKGALWKMVRNIAGCVLAAGCGRLAPGRIDEMLAESAGGRNEPVPFQCLPGEGLCLEQVHYDDFGM